MSIFRQHYFNKQLAKQGIAVKFDPNPDGTVPTIYVRLVVVQSPRFQAAFNRHFAPLGIDPEKDEVSDELDRAVMAKVFAETAVTGWENMRLPDGAFGIGRGEGPADKSQSDWDYDVPFSVENAAILLTELDGVLDRIRDVSTNRDSYREGDLEALAKN